MLTLSRPCADRTSSLQAEVQSLEVKRDAFCSEDGISTQHPVHSTQEEPPGEDSFLVRKPEGLARILRPSIFQVYTLVVFHRGCFAKGRHCWIAWCVRREFPLLWGRGGQYPNLEEGSVGTNQFIGGLLLFRHCVSTLCTVSSFFVFLFCIVW